MTGCLRQVAVPLALLVAALLALASVGVLHKPDRELAAVARYEARR